MKNLIFSLSYFFLFTQTQFAYASQLRALIKIEKQHKSFQMMDLATKYPIPGVSIDEKVRKQLKDLKDGDEAIVVGEIQYPNHKVEGGDQHLPYFLIHEIHPISIKELGMKSESNIQSTLELSSKSPEYIPVTIPITTEVASAITLTTSLMLMNELSSTRTTDRYNRDVTNALFLSTGLMATLFLIYEQIEGKKTK